MVNVLLFLACVQPDQILRLLTKWRSIGLPLDDGNKLEGYASKVGSPLLCY